MPTIFHNLINGKWIDAASKATLESINPADTADVIGTVPDSGKTEVDAAVAAARAALPGWKATPAPRRGEIIFRAAEQLARHKDDLGRLVTREMGKILSEGLGDVQEAIDMAYYMAGEGRRLNGETVPSELFAKDCKSVRVPVGVFGLISPWNFPTAIPAWKIFPCLVAGNTIVFKPSSMTPVAATRLVEIINNAGLPPGVINLVHGTGDGAGDSLATHPGLDGLSFTGSTAVGERLLKTCASAGKELSCEMGGKNPIIVMDDARLELAVEGALWGAFGTSGQRCTAASRLIVHEKIHDRFMAMFLEAARGLRVGNGLDKSTHMGPVISATQMKKVLGYIETGKKEGALLALGGKRLLEGTLAKGFFIEPTVFTGVEEGMKIAQEEIFGPVAAVMKAKDLEDAIRKANSVEYGLSSSIYTQDINNSAIAERDLETGIVYINAPTIGAEIQLPFGGVKKSGLGKKEAGGRGGALDTFTRWKVIYRDFSGRLQKAQIDNG